ncbi:MAG: hypothetical protein RIB52_00165 [Erythrobacter sp.]|uniref:hypothetical protein n=1 Tax=Erythrobacter sp. TaxID=1042 RepID=UPI0032ED9A68
MKTTSRILLVGAAAGMALAPISAHANTRASDSGVVYSAPVSQPGEGRAAEGENVGLGAGFIAAILAAIAAAGVIIIIDDDDDQSPGT